MTRKRHFADGVQRHLTIFPRSADLKYSANLGSCLRMKPTTVVRWQALGVSTVLEGSVRREGNRARQRPINQRHNDDISGQTITTGI